MITINNIIEEIKDVPINRLEELHLYVKSLIPRLTAMKNDEFANVINDAEVEYKAGNFTKIKNEVELDNFFESL